jgi:hypothetical protein
MRAAGPQSALVDDVQFREARNAVYVVSFGNGLLFASWAAQIPQVRAELGVTPGVLGLILWWTHYLNTVSAAGPVQMPLSLLLLELSGYYVNTVQLHVNAADGPPAEAGDGFRPVFTSRLSS